MRKLMFIIASILSISAVFAAGCKGENSDANGMKSREDTQQQRIDDSEQPNRGECPDDDCPDESEEKPPMPNILPRIPDKRHGDRMPVPSPKPVPPHRRSK